MKNKFFKIRPPPEWGIEPVPENMKILRFIDISILWFSLAIGLLVIQAGAFLTLSPEYGGFGLNILEAFTVSLIGSLIGSFILALASIIGIKYSVTSMVSLRPSFGLLGSYLPSILNVIQLIGWTIFEFIIMGEAATSISGQFLGLITKYVWITFFAIIVYLMIVYGPLIVIKQWLEKFAIWFAIIGATWLTYQLLNMKTLTINLINNTTQFNTILLALDLVIAMPVSWLPLVSDYNRFAKSKKDGFFGTFISYTIANTWFYLIGAMLALVYPKEAITYSMALIFFGLFALLIILIDEPDNAFADVYSAAVSIQNIFPKQKQWKIALIITILSLLFAYSIPIIQYENFLLLIGASFVPVFSILLSDYFLNKFNYKKDQFYSTNMKINLKAIISWIIGFIVYYYFAYINVTIGATIPSIIFTFIIYTILNYFKR